MLSYFLPRDQSFSQENSPRFWGDGNNDLSRWTKLDDDLTIHNCHNTNSIVPKNSRMFLLTIPSTKRSQRNFRVYKSNHEKEWQLKWNMVSHERAEVSPMANKEHALSYKTIHWPSLPWRDFSRCSFSLVIASRSACSLPTFRLRDAMVASFFSRSPTSRRILSVARIFSAICSKHSWMLVRSL